MKALPLPVRVIDKEGNVIFQNPHWQHATNRPNPRTFLPFEKHLHPREFWGILPKSRQRGIYRVSSFLLGENYLGQIAETLEIKNYRGNLKSLVQHIFKTMAESGYARGRFYRIIKMPSHNRDLLCLDKGYTYGSLNKGVKLPKTHSLDGALLSRLRKCQYLSNKLTYTIRKTCDDEKYPGDRGLKFWNQIIKAQNIDSWLEVPILRKNNNKNEYQPVALFVFDKFKSKISQNSIADGRDKTVTRKEVDKIAPTLRYMIRDVCKILELQENKEKIIDYETLVRLDKELYLNPEKEKIEQALLNAAVKLVEADGGLLAPGERNIVQLKVTAAYGSVQKKIIGSIFLKTEKHFPIVRCWKTKKNVIINSFIRKSRAVIKNADAERICPNDPLAFSSWLKNQVGSVAALPICINKQPIAILSLQHKDKNHFTQNRIEKLTGLLDRASWFLHTINVSDSTREAWEYAFVHEVKNLLSPILDNMDLIQEKITETDKDSFLIAQEHALKLRTLSKNFMDVEAKKISTNTLSYFSNTQKIICEYLAICQPGMDYLNQTIILSPDNSQRAEWQQNLRGNEAFFQRVIYNLIDNALKYGGEDSKICLSASLDNCYWILKIQNPGQMTAEENRLKFIAYQKPEIQRSDGAHVGLAASVKIVEAYGGRLTLKNIQIKNKKFVETTLSWPISRRKR
ncbi:GAF domain-containing sensor histidine kinase [Candidatus Venteria ishoeyi]|nr:ATP-binding protein [Candidatus Venteria ishoeyi]